MKLLLHILTAVLLATLLHVTGFPPVERQRALYAERMYVDYHTRPYCFDLPWVDTMELTTPWLRPRAVRMLFAGDVMQHMPQVTSARQADGSYNYARVFEYVAPHIKGVDLAVVNLETTLSDRHDYSGYPCFRSPAALADGLLEAGVDVCVLANNHCCDNGARGVQTTIAELDRCGIAHTGVFADSADYRANHPLRLEIQGVRVALLNYTYGTNGLNVPGGMVVNLIDTVAMALDLDVVRREGYDCTIVVLHWGEEYERHENRAQQRVAAFLRRNGVDLVVGSHPHVVQPFEIDSSGGVLYSLGNFVSNQRKRHTDGGLMARVDAVVDVDGAVNYNGWVMPVWVLLPDYRILTSVVGDTITMSNNSRWLYERFMTETRDLLYKTH